MDYEFILFERRGNVAWITLNRPDVRNAIKPEMREELIRGVRRGRPATSSCARWSSPAPGDGFCTGADIGGASKRQGEGGSAWPARRGT